ncbi:glycerate kinase [bacterium BMS3Abin03]|nr:glycerate kinase [bacterium BMS3Abin03]
MSKSILISPNSFKECSNSVNISDLIYKNLKMNSEDKIIRAPISDGGDGFTEVCKYYFRGRLLTYKITKPYSDTYFDCSILYSEETKTVYIESANVLGLKLIPKEFRDPLRLSSKGLGEILNQLERETYPFDNVIIGMGGTGTSDIGLGACSVLGFKLFDHQNNELDVIPVNYSKAKSIEWERRNFPFNVYFILDVDNPLSGKDGTVRVFAKQKGADENTIEILERGFDNVLNLLQNNKLYTSSNILSGAGGGIPSGFNILFNSSNIPAREFILTNLDLRKQIELADLVITGEGSFDSQSLMGKGAGIVLNEALKLEKEVILICGRIDDKLKSILGENVKYIDLQSYFENEEDSIKNYKMGIEKACKKIVNMIN